MLCNHILLVLEKATEIFKQVALLLKRKQSIHIKFASILYVSFCGSMLSRILNTMLLPIKSGYHITVGNLLKLVIRVEDVVRSLPPTETLRHCEEWNPGT